MPGLAPPNSMSPKLLKRVELATNLAIVATTLLICLVLVKTYFLSPPASAASGKPVTEDRTRVGETLSIPGVEWSGKGQTLVLAPSSECVYCTTSAPFYRRLAQERGNLRLVAVTPQNVEAGQRYLERLGVPVDEVRQVSRDTIGVQGTPTLLLVDERGSVTREWIGKLPAAQEAEVLSYLNASAAR